MSSVYGKAYKPFARSPLQVRCRAIRFAAIDLPRHGSPTIVTTSGARSGHGDVVCVESFAIESGMK